MLTLGSMRVLYRYLGLAQLTVPKISQIDVGTRIVRRTTPMSFEHVEQEHWDP